MSYRGTSGCIWVCAGREGMRRISVVHCFGPEGNAVNTF